MSVARLPDFADELAEALSAFDAGRVEIPMIQPAEPFLDMAGEDLRRRIFLTESETGESLCLRPEFTIPVCRAHIAEGVATPRRYSYFGQVFRQRREGGSEFYQAGIEDLGEQNTARADARAMVEACNTLRMLLSNAPLAVTMGDQALFEAVVAGLGLPQGWQKRLVHAFGNAAALEQMIDRLANPETESIAAGPAAGLIAAGDEAGLARHIQEAMEATGYSTHASRSPAEIAHRMIDKSRLEQTRLSSEALSALKTFLGLETPLGEAIDAMRDFAAKARLDIDGALSLFGERIGELESHGADLSSLTWRAAFGRPLDYYTGLVFEIADAPGGAVLAGGGRYDRMMELLGARDPIPAVGFSLWVDRIENLREAK